MRPPTIVIIISVFIEGNVQENIEQIFKMNITRYSDNNGAKDQFTEWARDSKINGQGGFKTYGKARTDYDKKQDDKEKNKN